MPTSLSTKFFDLLRIHIEKGLPIERLSFTAAQKLRASQCVEAYRLYQSRPWMKLHEYFRNRYGHTEAEITNDVKIVNFLISLTNEGQRELDRYKVRYVANAAIEAGSQSGNHDLALRGAAELRKVERLDQPESAADQGELLAGMPIIITGDVTRKYKNKESLSSAEMDRIRAKYGVKKDPWQDATEITEADFEEVPTATAE